MEWWLTTCIVLLLATYLWLRKTQSRLQGLSSADLLITPSVCVYFSSPQALDTAQQMVKAGLANGATCEICALEEFNESRFRRLKSAFFIVDCNVPKFMSWLEAMALRKEKFPGLRFAVYGIGELPLDQPNPVRELEAGLAKLGAAKLFDVPEEDFTLWSENAWIAFRDEGVRLTVSDKYLDVMIHCQLSDFVQGEYSHIAQQNLRSIETRVLHTRELKRDPENSALHVEFDANGIEYSTVDNIGLFPENTDEQVSEIATLQEYDLNTVFKFVPRPGKDLPFPTPCSVATALSKYCDLTGLYSKQTIKNLAEFAMSPAEKEHLLHLTSLKGKADYARGIQASMMSLAMLFKAFPSIRCPVHLLVQILPRIQPRYYTLASSPRKHPESMHIAVSVTRHVTADGSRFTGLCSGFLERMHLTKLYKPVRLFLKPSSFGVPRSPAPLWMVCNGCGIAPFRAILQELSLEGRI